MFLHLTFCTTVHLKQCSYSTNVHIHYKVCTETNAVCGLEIRLQYTVCCYWIWVVSRNFGTPIPLPKNARSTDSLCTSVSQLAWKVAKLVTTVAVRGWFRSRHCSAPTEVFKKLWSGYFGWCDVKEAQGHWRVSNKGWVLNRGGVHSWVTCPLMSEDILFNYVIDPIAATYQGQLGGGWWMGVMYPW